MPKFLKYILISPLIIYRYFISPLYPPCCKFVPSCSSYALEAYQNYNIFKASWLVFKRLIKCHPFSKGGFDPLPKKTK